jgi:Na+-transporting NADH:ubiquinone oxidoreductase subunit D
MMVETLIIAFYVIIIDVVLGGYWPSMRANLGPYVGLIITNCIVMGRCEAYGNNQPVGKAFLDGFFNALGYTFILLIIAMPRELMGLGTFLGRPVPFFAGPGWDKWIIMVTPPGAFFMLGLVVWLFRWIQQRREEVTK